MSRVRWLLFLGVLAVAAGGGWWFGRGLWGTETMAAAPGRSVSAARISPSFAAAGTAGGSWVARVRKAQGAGFLRLLAEWESAFPRDTERGEDRAMRALSWMFGVWATKDLEGVLEAMKVPDSDYDYQAQAALALVRVFPATAAELIAGSARGEFSESFVSYLSNELAKRNPELFLKRFPHGAEDSAFDWNEAVAALAKTNPRAAANACLLWKSENRRYVDTAFFAAVEAWREGDAALAEWIAGIADPEMRRLAENARLAALAKKDPRAALAELAAVDLGETIYLEEGRDARLEIVAGLAKADPAAAFALLRDVEASFSKYPATGDPFADVPAEKNPGLFGVFNFGGATPADNALRNTIVAALAENLPDDPAAVFGALHGLNRAMGGADEAWQRGLDADLIRQRLGRWPGTECFAVAGLWMSELGGAADDSLVRELSKRAASDAPDAALAALGSLPEAARQIMAGEIVKALPAGHPEQRNELFGQLSAAQWDDDLGTALGANGANYAAGIAALPAETTAGARESFVAKWGDRDPEAAARWVGGLPADAAAFPSGYGLARAWSAYDEYAASAWAAALPAGPARDGAAAALARTLAESQPETARQWAASISDPGKRTEAMRRFVPTAPETLQNQSDPFAIPDEDGN